MTENNPIFQQSAVIPFRQTADGLRVMVISNRSRKRWIIPKGLIEENLSPKESAAVEAFEEAGVRGTVLGESVGEYQYNKWGGTCVVEVFLMRVEEVHDEWPESFRDRRWISADEAALLIKEKKLKGMLGQLGQLIEQFGH